MVSTTSKPITHQAVLAELARYHDKFMAEGLSFDHSADRIQRVITENPYQIESVNEKVVTNMKATPCYDAYNIRAQTAEETNFSCIARAFLDVGELFGCIADLTVELGNAKEEYKDCTCELYNINC